VPFIGVIKVMNNEMSKILNEWKEYISEKEMPVNCVTREIETDKFFEKDKRTGGEKPRLRRTKEQECDLVYIPPRETNEETEPLSAYEKDKRKKIRIKITKQKERARGAEKRKQNWLSGMLEEDEVEEAKKKEKPACGVGNPNHRSSDGQFSSKEDAAVWSLQWTPSKQGTKCGVARSPGQKFTSVPCGRANAHGGKSKKKCHDSSDAY